VLQKSADFDLLSNSDTTYVGNLVSDDYQTAEYTIDIKSKANTISVPVVLQYMDSNNKYYEKNFNVQLNLIDNNKINPKSSGGSLITIIVIVLIAGGIWYFLKRRSKKNKKGQFYQ
jgi:ATP-dependent Zn protease